MAEREPPQDLQHVRESIEEIDRKILHLFRSRMDLVEEVATAKIRNAWPFRDPNREDKVFQRVRKIAIEMGLDPHHTEGLYRGIMNMAIAHQQSYLHHLDVTPLRVAYQGVEGAYSHLAAQQHYRGREGGVLLYGYETFLEAAETVRDGSNDLALLPIENSTAGSINETYDILTEGAVSITSERYLRVSHCLLGLPGATVDELREIYSHPQALRQCARFLRSLPKARSVEAFDTAGAARKIREAGDASHAAIASATAAKVAGLEVLRSDIQDQRHNFTRFVEIAREEANCPPDHPCKTSLSIETGNRPGELGEVLQEFARRSINLTKLESRPIPERPFQYRFYLDIEGHRQTETIAEALGSIEQITGSCRVLGSYPSWAADDLE